MFHFHVRNLFRGVAAASTKKTPARRGRPLTVNVTPKKARAVSRSKKNISAALREQVWLQHQGRVFDAKCLTPWCTNRITVFDFQCGHDIPESKGGTTDLTNLYPICSRCNLSMGNAYTFKEWAALSPVGSATAVSVQSLPPEMTPTCFSRVCQWWRQQFGSGKN